jgi:alanyl-tRNA synthetase
MKQLSYIEIRNSYLDFMKSQGHAEIINSSLVPENDPTLLFVNSGMFPIVPFLMGESHPKGTRITNVQRCIRTEDLEEVGDPTHFTAFEMIGNWSLDDYFKEQALTQTYEFFIEKLGLPVENLYGSVFEGDEDAPVDTVSIDLLTNIFKRYGLDAKVGLGEHIQVYPKKKNWWGLAGGGPCGTTSEIFYDTGKEKCSAECHINCDCGKYVEIGNNVFMEFLNKDGKYLPLGRHNVDFGGGLERIVQVVQKVSSNYDIDIYRPIGDAVRSLAVTPNVKSERIIVDHIKSATWIIMDGVQPGKTEKEYVLRRIIRRAIRHGMSMGIDKPFTRQIGLVCIEQFAPIYPQLKEKQELILSALEQEELKFRNTLKAGVAQVNKYIAQTKESSFTNENGESFTLYESFGYPPEMFLEELLNSGITVDADLFWKNHQTKNTEHQDKSRTAAQGLFKGGLADTSEVSTYYHTLTHLLLASLRKHIGTHIYQKGSNNSPERLRFDFPNEEKLTPEQIATIEAEINGAVAKKLPVTWEEMSKKEGLKLVPFAAFDDKYGDRVKVYTIGDKSAPFSQELCNGPHVKNTGDIKGTFKIVQHEKIGSGIFRVKGVLV